MKRIVKVFLALFLVITVSGCKKENPVEPAQGSKEFEELLNKWFAEDMGEDYLNLHFSVKNPEKYGITVPSPDFGVLDDSDEAEEKEEAELEERKKQLAQFDISTFNTEQLLAYKCLMFEFETKEKYDELEEYFDFPFTPNSGLNNNVPTYFTEFEFRSEKDFDDLISLVNDSKRVFDYYLDYLKELNEAGKYQSDAVIDEIIESCERFISHREDNEVIVVFNKGVDEFKLINADDYKKRMKDAVMTKLIPAYEEVIAYYKTIYGKAKSNLGLAQYDHGKDYYALILRDRVATDKTVKEVEQELKAEITRTFNNIVDLSNRMPSSLYNQFINEDYDYGYSDPYEILEFLKSKMGDDYPEIPEVEYSVNYLDESVATDGVVAYYLICPIDDVTDNVIKCNKKYVLEDTNYLCTTLAHEGYPGHLYQNTYYYNRPETLPFRGLFDYSGYAEGWAMYVEYDSTYYFTDKKQLAEINNLYEQFNYYLYGYFDIMFNYEGWNIERATKFLSSMYYEDTARRISESIRDVVVGDPTVYLSYSYGYYEIANMRENAKADLGDKFVLKDFNKVILETGPVPFPVLQEQIDKYVEANMPKSK